MNLVLAILKAIAAIPSMKAIFDMALSQYLAWLDAKEAERITNSASELRNAKTKEEKQDALKKWRNSAK